MSVRRRGLIGAQQNEVIPPLEYPDAYMIVFNGDANVSKQIVYRNSISRYILDGVETVPSSSVRAITPTTTGTHVLYFWMNTWTRLQDHLQAKYLRIPKTVTTDTGWLTSFVYNVSITQIDCLSATPYPVEDPFGQYCSDTTKVRVPIGSAELYKAADRWSLFGNKIEETNNFNYTI